MNSVDFLKSLYNWLPILTPLVPAIIALVQLRRDSLREFIGSIGKRSKVIRELRVKYPEIDAFYRNNRRPFRRFAYTFLLSFLGVAIPAYTFLGFSILEANGLSFYLFSNLSIVFAAAFPVLLTIYLRKRISIRFKEPETPQAAVRKSILYTWSRPFRFYWGWLGFGIFYYVLYILLHLIPTTSSIVIPSLAFVYYGVILYILYVISKVRKQLFYELESQYLFSSLSTAPIRMMVHTSKSSMLHYRPKICAVKGLGKNLEIEFAFEGKIIAAQIRWKDVLTIGFERENEPQDVE